MKKDITAIIMLFVLLASIFPAFGKSEIKGRYAAFDVDSDGALSRQEVGPIARRSFDKYDRNGDGKLEGREVRQFIAGSVRRLQQSGRQLVEATIPVLSGEQATPDDITAYLRQTTKFAGIEGIALVVAKQGMIVYEKYLGNITLNTVVPVASGSKWMTAALLLSLVDDGVLLLDEPLAVHLPYLEGTPSAGVTLRHALSHTSGFGSEHMMTQPFDMGLAASARAVMNTKRVAKPGKVFCYTGVAMQLAAAAAEAATGRSWAELFKEKITGPLSLINTVYGHPMREISYKDNYNLIVESGIHTTAREYLRFLEMIAGDGIFRGNRILSEKAVHEMETDHTRGINQSYKPPGVKSEWGYGLGQWCEKSNTEGQCMTVNSAGAFGAFPWVDRQNNLYGIILMVDRLPRQLERHLATRKLVEEVFGTPSSNNE